MTAYYNDNDPFCAAWLRELIKAGLIALGEVDERSIEEVKPSDLRGFTQCHFFAGIGVWSYALRGAGWPDDEPVWTGSCPCPPFSSVGIKKACPQCEGTNPVPHVGRTGFFVCCLCDHEWFADGRHLWPELWRLISVGHPDTFFGEQVASDDGRTWLASVRASLEILGYAVGAADLCSAGVGASDIRQRLFFVGEPNGARPQPRRQASKAHGHGSASVSTGSVGLLEYATNIGHAQRPGEAGAEPERTPSRETEQRSGKAGDLGNPDQSGPQGYRRSIEQHGSIRRQEQTGRSSAPSILSDLAYADSVKSSDGQLQRSRRLVQLEENPLTGFWRDAEWIFCRDGKWRPVEPSTFPLVTRAPNRVGRLRGYGNAINAEVAKAFIEAYMSLER